MAAEVVIKSCEPGDKFCNNRAAHVNLIIFWAIDGAGRARLPELSSTQQMELMAAVVRRMPSVIEEVYTELGIDPMPPE